MAANLLEGKKVKGELTDELKKEAEALKNEGVTPCLVALQVGKNTASEIYIAQQRKACQGVGIDYQLKILPETITSGDFKEELKRLGENETVHGIIIQLPLPSSLNARELRNFLPVEKDVEGMHPQNMGLLTYGQPEFIPCTAQAAWELIKRTEVELQGQEVVIIGHSDIVGKPLALLLLERLATVTVCHIGTRDIVPHVKRADILIVAVGKPGLVKGEWIKEGAIVIDIGITRREGKIVGDVEFEEAVKRASWITPVPGGVGPLTVTMLLRNTIEAAKKSQK
jgi:methylenetetrahydrofolate dehydrogenase (NADP+)/methenyltetrahydrofolate cyclohydrolase